MSIPSASEQRSLLKQALTVKLSADRDYCAIERPFWDVLSAYIALDLDKFTDKPETVDAKAPGKINNAALLEEEGHGALKKGLQEKVDLEWIPREAWDLVFDWYGGGPEIARNVVLIGLRQMPQIEIFPLFATVYETDSKGEVITPDPTSDKSLIEMVSTHTTLADVVNGRKKVVNSSEEGDEAETLQQGRCWCKGLTPELLEQLEVKASTADTWVLIPGDMQQYKLKALNLPNGVQILVDWKTPEGVWSKVQKTTRDFRDFRVSDEVDAQDTEGQWYESVIRLVQPTRVQVHFNAWSAKYDEWFPIDSAKLAPKSSHTNGPHKSRSDKRYGKETNHKGKPVVKGAVGLSNLGNTCFMNSTIQCLSNTPVLTEFFVSGDYKAEINRQNPLGWRGKVADEWGKLMTNVWSGQYQTVSPSAFKRVIGEFQPRFEGYQQHDSSELLNFLLDGLHEDLNTVKEKPSVEAVECDEKSDWVAMAKEAWKRHQLRNRSKIVDTCMGQIQSTVVCPDCDRTSVTFDPIMMYSVPVPATEEKKKFMKFILHRDPAMLQDKTEVQPVTYQIPYARHDSVRAFKEMVMELTGVNSKDMMVSTEADHCIQKILKGANLLHTYARSKICVYETVDKIAVEKENTTYEVTHWKTTKSMLRGPKKSRFGWSTVVPIKTAEHKTLSIATLRELMKASATSLLKGGWAADEDDTKLYSIHFMDQMAEKWYAAVDYDAETVDLDQIMADNNKKKLSVSLMWTEAGLARCAAKEVEDPVTMGPVKIKKKKEGTDIYDCLAEFCKSEKLRKTEAWYCRVCKKHQEANKKFDLWKLPPVIILHMKRFSFNNYRRNKIDSFVDFPLEDLDLSEYVKNPEEGKNAQYDLYAVSNHFGGTGGGHYTAYARNLVDGNWYNLDDSSTRRVDASDVKTKAAYVLFYVKKGFTGPQ